MLRPLLLLTTVEAFAYYTLTNVLTLHLTDVLGIGDAVAGMHFGFRGTVTMLFSTLVGPLIDCLGPLRVLPAAFALAAIGRAAFALADSPGLALFAMYVPMAAGHVREWDPNSRRRIATVPGHPLAQRSSAATSERGGFESRFDRG